MNDCLFCKIVFGDIPCDKIFESELLIAFRDIAPVSPTHILIIPKKHISSLNEMEDEDRLLAGEMLFCAKKIAKSENINIFRYFEHIYRSFKYDKFSEWLKNLGIQ